MLMHSFSKRALTKRRALCFLVSWIGDLLFLTQWTVNKFLKAFSLPLYIRYLAIYAFSILKYLYFAIVKNDFWKTTLQWSFTHQKCFIHLASCNTADNGRERESGKMNIKMLMASKAKKYVLGSRAINASFYTRFESGWKAQFYDRCTANIDCEVDSEKLFVLYLAHPHSSPWLRIYHTQQFQYLHQHWFRTGGKLFLLDSVLVNIYKILRNHDKIAMTKAARHPSHTNNEV